MIEIKRGTLADYDKSIDFIDFVFSRAHEPHDFEERYPNLYRKLPGYPENFYNLWVDGEIRGCVLREPRVLNVCGERIRVDGIGNVSTHHRDQGRGYMTRMMTRIVDDMKKEGVQLSVLGGRRSRYNHFGYEIAGNRFEMNVDPHELRAKYPDEDPTGWRFEEVAMEDRETVLRLKALYEAQPYHYEYDYDKFYLRLRHNSRFRVYGVWDPAGELAGHLSLQPGGSTIPIIETCLPNEKLADAVVALSLQTNASVRFAAAEWSLPYLGKVIDAGRELERLGSSMWNVLSWREPVRALLTLRSTYAELAPGKLVVETEPGVRLAIRVGDAVSVEYTDEAPDAVFDHFKATRAIFGPFPHYFFASRLKGEKLLLADSWFPLPTFEFGSEAV